MGTQSVQTDTRSTLTALAERLYLARVGTDDYNLSEPDDAVSQAFRDGKALGLSMALRYVEEIEGEGQ